MVFCAVLALPPCRLASCQLFREWVQKFSSCSSSWGEFSSIFKLEGGGGWAGWRTGGTHFVLSPYLGEASLVRSGRECMHYSTM
ncbi:uncharacterized protein BDV14DRAFT_172465 [Aspergillus stella-maris]|uniref:uncharacterized protein n=1 Tax=Aspergillus stella-maris TaxID=1810926 RepID=UPI003CCD9B4E